MNKGAETYLFMEELEARGLHDPRNPAGPLPTSLRPVLNRELQAEGVLDPRAIDRAYEALVVATTQQQPRDGDTTANDDAGFIDYYDFLKLFGPNSVTWNKQ